MNRRRFLATCAAAGLSGPALAAGEAPAPALAPANTVQILTYHRFETRENPPGTVVTPATFSAQMAWLVENNIPVLPLTDALAHAKGAATATPAVSITADDGWRSVFTEMFPVIQRHRFPVTLFLNPPSIGQGTAYLTWAMVAEMRASGLVDIQAHTLTHPNFNTEHARRTPSDYAAFVRHELADCRHALQDKLSASVDSLAWPFGIHNAALEGAAQEAGYTAAYALGSRPVIGADPLFAVPRSQIYESDSIARFGWMATGHARKQQGNTAS
jgi:peptidoglycan/xylan/chitin deacetylase (PgdA/CDA1 family)